MMFTFSLIRAVALILRMAWASHPTNVRLSIAANIIGQAGTVLVFLMNLFFTQRIIRGYHPNFGWSTPYRVLHRFLVASVAMSLIMIIVATVQSFFTLDEVTRAADRKVQLFGSTYLAVLAFLPIPMVLLAIAIPRKYVIEKFGTGSWRAKLFLLLFTATIMTMGAAFRAGTNFVPRPLNNPAWYHTRGPYYAFNYVPDLIVTYLYLTTGFHKRFHIPNGAKGPGSYMGALPTEKTRVVGHTTPSTLFQSAETLAQVGTDPSHMVHDDAASSIKKGRKGRKQRNRLSKSNPKFFGRSTTSIDSQHTYVASHAPSIASTNTSMHRGITGAGRYGELPMGADMPPLPPLPVLTTYPGMAVGHSHIATPRSPTRAGHMYNTTQVRPGTATSGSVNGISREGTIYEDMDDHQLPHAVTDMDGRHFDSYAMGDMSGVGTRHERMSSARGSIDIDDLVGTGAANGYRPGTADQASNGVRTWETRDFAMSGAGGNGAPATRGHSRSSSGYTGDFEVFDNASSGRHSRQSGQSRHSRHS